MQILRVSGLALTANAAKMCRASPFGAGWLRASHRGAGGDSSCCCKNHADLYS